MHSLSFCLIPFHHDLYVEESHFRIMFGKSRGKAYCIDKQRNNICEMKTIFFRYIDDMTDVDSSVWPDLINKHHNSSMCLFLDILQTAFVRRFRENRGFVTACNATTTKTQATTNTSVNQMTKLNSQIITWEPLPILLLFVILFSKGFSFGFVTYFSRIQRQFLVAWNIC